MSKEETTNAMRILNSAGVEYTTFSYEWDEDHLDAVHAAQSAGFPAEQLYKTIVMKASSNRLYVFCVPTPFEISLKKAREITGEKAIELLKLTELQKNTGYIRGGCSPLGMIRQYPTYIEELAQLYPTVYVSAGRRGLLLGISPTDLARLCRADFVSFT